MNKIEIELETEIDFDIDVEVNEKEDCTILIEVKANEAMDDALKSEIISKLFSKLAS